MDSYKLPILSPTPAILNGLPNGGQVRQGRDLYRLALEDQYAQGANAVNVPKWVNRIQRRRRPLPGHRTRLFNEQYGRLPSPLRRAWEAESHKRWPRAWHGGQVSSFDVYANDDEIYYTRKAGRWSWTEDQIRQWYRQEYDMLVVPMRTPYQHAARAINHARNLPALGLQPPQRFAKDNGPLPTLNDNVLHIDDKEAMPNMLKSLPSDTEARGGGAHKYVWEYGARIGGSSTFGAACVYRLVNTTTRNTEFRVVLKRDRYDDITNARERHLLRRLTRRIARSRPVSKNIVKCFGSSGWSGTEPGRTWLKYAKYGDLHGLIKYYSDNNLVFPEPFVWYIFHGLAEALLFLESGQTTPGAAADPTWRPIFHADIKPANILLYHEETGNGAHTWHGHYPMPLLTDFGGAESYPHPNATDQIPSHILGMGTNHFVPFEMTTDAQQLDSNAERVWGPRRELELIKKRKRKAARLAAKREAKKQKRRQEVGNSDISEVSDVPSSASETPFPRRPRDYHKPELPAAARVRIHTSVYQLGVVVWCLLTSDPWPEGYLFRDETAPRAPPARNLYPAWWDALPRHAARRPWPWARAAAADRADWLVAVDRGFAPPQRGDASPRGLRRAKRPRTYAGPVVAGGPLHWWPYPPAGAMRPHFSGRLVELAYWCMRPLPEDRPTPTQLVQATQDAMSDILARFPDVQANQTAQPGARPRGVVLPPDKFPVGGRVLTDVWAP